MSRQKKKKKKTVVDLFYKKIVNPSEAIILTQSSLYSFFKCWKVHPANVYLTLTILLQAIGH